MKLKCTAPAEGFTEGESYPVLGFGETAVVLANDDGQIVTVSHAKANSEGWDVEVDGAKKKKSKGKS